MKGLVFIVVGHFVGSKSAFYDPVAGIRCRPFLVQGITAGMQKLLVRQNQVLKPLLQIITVLHRQGYKKAS